ncbi:GDYXXLXY domain-containing protein [Paenibacillus sp. R14(2021)]|uniref:GDYXXLXY domain-containing protein n=1 Tax=Paenibacillus sp. R14(2021) TaxID=2859228 RepID=UPI001C61660A|nr:GDYXXLXY domain-containing protein [Paenibacillus sp. R14(2021)]
MRKSELRPRRGSWLGILVALQLLFLAGIVLFHYSALWVGKDIRLQTVPVDPRDQLYGDYVQLNYQINSVEQTKWKSASPEPKRGGSVYVRLAENRSTKTYEVTGVYDRKPSRSAGEVVLKGRVQYMDSDRIRITYGLEQYYVQENTGKSLEQRAGNLIVHIKAAPWGSAVIDSIEP